MRTLAIRRLGLISYADGVELQRSLVEDRRRDHIPDTLLLLQHPHVITIGVRKGGALNVLADRERLAELGVEIFETGRGGDVTYHGPGQIVGYPILDLRPDRQDVHRYVRDLEEVMIRVCGEFDIRAERIPTLTGVWINGEKVGAIGVRISRWITSHGFAFNVNTDLDYFRLIVPCGIGDRGVTSLAKVTREKQRLADVEDLIVRHFSGVFERHAVDQQLSLTDGDRHPTTAASVSLR
ncbi:MAG TPA: lipoyl(octanoyl) transferase LipB [Vicinamibacterales bacterium]|nr:lipoyl(octanoyl) transferase LipB [Vicinamibacterales bacterium]